MNSRCKTSSNPIPIPKKNPPEGASKKEVIFVGSPASAPRSILMSRFMNTVLKDFDEDFQIPLENVLSAYSDLRIFLDQFKQQYAKSNTSDSVKDDQYRQQPNSHTIFGKVNSPKLKEKSPEVKVHTLNKL